MRRGLILGICACALFLGAMGGAFGQGQVQRRSLPAIPSPAPKQAVKPEPEIVYFKGKLLAETQETLSEVVVQDVINQIWKHADSNGHEGEYNHFINTSRILMLSNPHETEPFATSAYLLWSTDRIDEALKLLKQGLAANPDTYYFYDEIGAHYLLRVKDYKSAIPYYEKAIAKKPPYMTYNMLATCYERTNQPEKAIEILEKGSIFTENKIGQRRLRNLKAKYPNLNKGGGAP